MQASRGITKLVTIVSVAVSLVLILIIIFILNLSKDDEPVNITLEDATKVISLDERSSLVSAENITITQSNENFVRGRLLDKSDGKEKDFYLIKIGDSWRVVEVTDQSVSCERFARLGFPNVFIQDCKLSFSDAVTLSEIDQTLADFFLSSENLNLKIVGVVENIEETENGQIITMDSGGEKIQVQLSISTPKVQEGDLVVTSITPPNNYTSNTNTQSTTIIYTSNNTVAINENDRDLFVDTTVNTNNQNNNNQTYDTNNPSNKIYKINAPKTSAPPSYFFNVYDIDNSFLDVELEGSF